MATVPQAVRAAGLLAPLLLLSAGCVGPGWFTTAERKECPPKGPAHKVVATWNNQVVFSPDPCHGGREGPGLAGRVYLFGPDLAHPRDCDGNIVVDLFDETTPGPDGKGVWLEEWRFDPATLKKLLRKDLIGWGYTLFLPWSTYKPEATRVRLRLRFEPPQGVPLYADGSTLTLTPPEVSGTKVGQSRMPLTMPQPGPAGAPKVTPSPAETLPAPRTLTPPVGGVGALTSPSRVGVVNRPPLQPAGFTRPAPR